MMKLNRGLFYKDIYLQRKTLTIGFLGWFLYFIIAASVILSRDFGNLKYVEDFDEGIITLLIYASVFIIVMLLMDDSGVIYSDKKTKWDIMVYSMPVSAEEYSFTKLFEIIVSIAAGAVLSLLSSVVLLSLYHKSLDLDSLKNHLLIFTAALFLTVLSTAVKLKYKDRNIYYRKISIAAAVIYVIIFFPFIKLFAGINNAENIGAAGEDMNIDGFGDIVILFEEAYGISLGTVRDIVFMLFPVLAAAIVIVGYSAFLKIEKRREN